MKTHEWWCHAKTADDPCVCLMGIRPLPLPDLSNIRRGPCCARCSEPAIGRWFCALHRRAVIVENLFGACVIALTIWAVWWFSNG